VAETVADGADGAVPGLIRPVERPVPLRQSVYEALVELIVAGTLRPGQHLVESELARQLGVSRQPVREALHRLEAEGWIDLRPSQGAFVHVPTDTEVDQLLDVRELLEGATARLAVTSRGPSTPSSSRRSRRATRTRRPTWRACTSRGPGPRTTADVTAGGPR
jgi:DNA-binding GntR family transcriptional regulator